MTQLDPLLQDLLSAQDLPALAGVARRGLQMLGLEAVDVIWSPFPGSSERWHTLSGIAPDAATLALLEQNRRSGRALPSSIEAPAPSGRFLRVLAQNTGLWLAVTGIASPDRATPGWQHWLQPLAQRCQNLLHTLRLQVDVERLANAERLQRALFAISDIASSDLSTKEVLHSLHQVVGRLMYAEHFYIVRFDPALETLCFIYFADSNDPYPPSPEQVFQPEDMRNSLTLAMLRHGKPLRGASMDIRAKMHLIHEAVLGPDSVDWLGVPIIEDGVVRGGVVVQSYDTAVHYSEDDQALLGYVAQHILIALSRREVQEELEFRVEARTLDLRREIHERQRSEKLQRALYRIAALSTSGDSLQAFFASIHEIVGELLDARNFYIALVTPDGEELDFPYSVDERDRHLPRRKLGRSLSEYVLRTGKPLLTDGAHVDALEAAGEVISVGTKSVCWLGVPLQIGDKVIGLITVQSYTPDYLYTSRDEELLSFVSLHIANALERRQVQESLRQANTDLEKRVNTRTSELADTNRELRNQILVRERVENKLKHEAMHDALTGLPNRNQLLTTLQHTLARYRRDPTQVFAVLFLDLDRFKVINDSVGHLVGDELLKEAARRISQCIRAPDSVARLGGDEFAIVIDLIHEPTDAVMVAERVILSLSEPMRITNKELYTSASIGIAFAHERYEQPEELLRDADVAMYRAKAAGRQRFALFDEYLHEDALRQLELEGELRRALLREEFVPYYQPIVRLSDGATVGFEALARWQHPQRGCLAPAEFLATAEETGTLVQIDWQIYEQVCRDLQRIDFGATYVTINVSPRHLRTLDFAERILGMLAVHGVRPESLRLEITEGALLEEPEQVEQCLAQLSVAGVHTMLDDFGTGYSSLSYLHRFSLYGLKIDRSFVAALREGESGGSTAIVRAIRLMADSLGLEVVAEGIEAEDQRQQLRLHGLTLGQGFLFTPPMPIDDIDASHFTRPAARR